MISKKRHIITVCLLLAVCVLSFGLGRLSLYRSSKLLCIEHLTEQIFPLEHDRNASTDIAAYAYTASLNDPYTEYMTAEEYSAFMQSLNSEYTGIGILIDISSQSACVAEVYDGSPAEEAGVVPGDILLSVDSIIFSEDTYNSAVDYITGVSDSSPDDDTAMHFTVQRDGDVIEFDIKRGEYSVPEVTSQMMDGDILYIALSAFSESSATEFAKVIKQADNAKGLILDLRSNPGGLVTSLMDIASHIMPEGLIFSSVDAKGHSEEYAIEGNSYTPIPLVVLVNGDSASASEILSAAVKESGRGILIGETTYGKGLVQVLIPFSDGSVLKITEAKYYTKNGAYINGVGVTPDISVSGRDEQLAAALEYFAEN